MSQPEAIHVIPINDLREHSASTDCPCWCCPRTETQEDSEQPIIYGQFIVHNSADGRELLEEMNPLLSDRPIGLFLAQVMRVWGSSSITDIPQDQAFHLALNWLSRRFMYYRPVWVPLGRPMPDDIGDRIAADFLELFLPRAEVGDEEG